MLRLTFFVLALVTVASAGVAAPVPPAAQKPVRYYPTTVGAKWVYEWGGADRIEEVTAVDEKDGQAVVTVGVLVDKKFTPYCKVLVSDRGLFFGTGGLEEKTFPNALLKLPAKPGSRWDWEVREVGRKVVCTVGPTEDVEVPAGKFRAVRVESEVPVGKDLTQTTTTWYAPEVGWVKMVSRVGGAEETKALKSFAPGKS
ncbi:hypothetical protein R5W24_002776 [Gemmata sp. JC717]|uniref:TapB family protein n=1 Tax=Gemmata algarum TaxID=2975278 RepID=UPI0021BB6CC0|nr:hypothetical protein [Gemmata algarum]MDY3553671.1 hypothetical protein [Gemmata algarum]